MNNKYYFFLSHLHLNYFFLLLSVALEVYSVALEVYYSIEYSIEMMRVMSLSCSWPWEENICLSLLSIILVVEFYRFSSSDWGSFHIPGIFWDFLSGMDYWIFLKWLFHIYEDDPIFACFESMNVMNYVDCISNVKPFLISGINPAWKWYILFLHVQYIRSKLL